MADEDREELNVQHNDEEHQQAESGDTQQQPEEAAEGEKKEGGGIGSVLSAPGSYGNAAGSKIESTLGKVGGPLGTGLEKATAPIGSVVDPVVGGLNRMPEAVAQSGEQAMRNQKENAEWDRPVGGGEQTGRNPLGLGGEGGGEEGK